MSICLGLLFLLATHPPSPAVESLRRPPSLRDSRFEIHSSLGLLSDSRRGTRPGIARRCPYPFSLFERSQPLGITGPLLQLSHYYTVFLTQKTTGIHRDLGFERTRKRQPWPAVPLFSSYHVVAQPLRPWLAAGSCRWSGRIVELSNCRIVELSELSNCKATTPWLGHQATLWKS